MNRPNNRAFQRPSTPTLSSRDLKNKLKAELDASAYDHNLRIAKYRLASLLEFCNEQDIDFDNVLIELGVVEEEQSYDI